MPLFILIANSCTIGYCKTLILYLFFSQKIDYRNILKKVNIYGGKVIFGQSWSRICILSRIKHELNRAISRSTSPLYNLWRKKRKEDEQKRERKLFDNTEMLIIQKQVFFNVGTLTTEPCSPVAQG